MKHPFGGYVFFGENEGCIYIADNKDLNQSKNVWKWGLGGLGFSSTGINGTYETAITQDGQIVADFITTGKLNTNVIEGYESLTAQVKSTAESVSNLEITTGKISASVESIESKTEELSVDIDGVKENIIPTSTTSGPNIHIEDASDKKMVNFEIEGKSEQATRSGKNLFNKNSTFKANGATKEVLETGVRSKLINAGNYRYFSVELGKSELLGKTITLTRTITNSASNMGQISLFFGNETSQSKKFIFSNRGSGTSNKYIPNTFPEDCDRIWVLFYGNVTGTGNVGDYTDYTDLMITLGDTLQNYEDYGVSPSPDYPSEIESVGTYNEETGKYEIEVKNTGKNLLNLPDGTYTHNGITAVISNGIININGTSTAKSFLTIPINLELESNFSISLNNTAMGDSLSEVRLQISGSNFRSVSLSVANNKRENISIYGTYTSLLISISSGVTITNGIIKPQVELGYTTDYEPYQQNTSLFVLDQPLRSLPNGVKDIAYIKNNILYVDRNIRHLELPIADMNNNEDYPGWINQTQLKKDYPAVNNNFSYLSISLKSNITDDASAIGLNTNGSGVLFLRTTKFNLTQTQWKTNYSNLIFVLDYELAEPYTEKIGEVEIPSTFKGVNNITTTDELEPVMNIEYVRDTILSDYVEKQISNVVAIQERKNAEFQITNDEIKSSVSNISTDLDGTKSSLNSVEEKITSQEKTINIISKNIDGTTGDIREVTTTTGFTFNAEGMTIDDGAGYKAQHTAQGTFYKDGDSITGQYTKDGSKQKDLELFGTYSYGKNDINDTPMFVAQLYIDEKGEECFGHFINI